MSGNPNVTATNITSTRPNGAYVAGDVIDLEVTLPFAVTWSNQRPFFYMFGQQAVQNSTTACGVAVYVSGNGTSTWTFEYRVRGGVNITDLSTSGAFTLGMGASLKKTSDSSAIDSMFLPTSTGSLSANKAITANTTGASTVTATSVDIDIAAGTYTAPTMMIFTVTFPEAITAMDRNSLNDYFMHVSNGTTVFAYAPYISGSGTNVWRFGLVSTNTFNNMQVETRIDVTSASNTPGLGFRRADGSYCNVLLPAHGDAATFSTSKTINLVGVGTSINATSVTTSVTDGAYSAGQVVDIAVTFAASKTLGSGSNPSLLMLDGLQGLPVGEATYVSGSGTTTWNFTYTVPAGVNITRLYVWKSILMNGNDLRTSVSLGVGSANSPMSKTITAVTKAVSTLVSTGLADATYDPPTNIDINVTLPFATTIAGGTPALALCDTDGTSLGVSAAYLSGSGTTGWVFRYVAGGGVVTADLRTGALATNGASFTKTSDASAVTVEVRDEWLGTLVADHTIGLSGIPPAPDTAPTSGFFVL